MLNENEEKEVMLILILIIIIIMGMMKYSDTSIQFPPGPFVHELPVRKERMKPVKVFNSFISGVTDYEITY